jgi:hypothetical protein
MEALRLQLDREVAHWRMAASRLGKLEDLASSEAWDSLERYLGISIRRNLSGAVDRLQEKAAALHSAAGTIKNKRDMDQVRRRLVDFRRSYLRTETVLDFYADAINTRTNPEVAALMRSCDLLARRSMSIVLDPLDKSTPHVLTYLDKGLGASILKAGLRLWDGGTENPAAAIKVVRHNLYRPTSLIHETGHQVAHIVGWNHQLALALEQGLSRRLGDAAEVWAGWASEIAADAFAFVHTGYAAVAGLHDVLDGDDAFVFRHIPGDPHPINYIRVLLGIEMSRRFFGPGPWDRLALAWKQNHPLENAEPEVRELLRHSMPMLPKIVEITLLTPMRAFRGRTLAALVDPQQVKPETLIQLERRVGPALFTSSYWAAAESLRVLALIGFRVATSPHRTAELLKLQETWMFRLASFSTPPEIKIKIRRKRQWLNQIENPSMSFWQSNVH